MFSFNKLALMLLGVAAIAAALPTTNDVAERQIIYLLLPGQGTE